MYWATEQDLHFWIIVAQYHNYFFSSARRDQFRARAGLRSDHRGHTGGLCSCTIGSPSLGWLGEIVLIRGRRRGVCLCQHDLRGAIGLGTHASEKRGGPLRTYFIMRTHTFDVLWRFAVWRRDMLGAQGAVITRDR